MRHPPPPREFVVNCGLLTLSMDIFRFRMCQNDHLVITDLCAKFYLNQWWMWLLMRQCPLKHKECPLKHKECPLKRQVVGRVVRSLGIQVAWTHERLCGGEYWLQVILQNFLSICHAWLEILRLQTALISMNLSRKNFSIVRALFYFQGWTAQHEW